MSFRELRPRSFYRVAWESLELGSDLSTGSIAPARVSFRNISTEVWPDAQMADPEVRGGAGAVRLSSRWWRDGEQLVSDYTARVDLPFPLRPGQRLTLPFNIAVPAEPGTYRLQVDLVHELVGWFEGQGASRLVVPVTVEARP